MRRAKHLVLCLCAGCVIGVNGSIPALSGGDESAAESGTSDDEGDDTSATEGGDSSTDAGDESAGPSTGVDPASESSGSPTPDGTSEDDGPAESTGIDVDPTDDDPPAGPWSSCDGGVPCPDPYGCLGIDSPPEAVCTIACNGADSSGCPPAPGGTTTPICITVTGVSVCALDCAADQSCPDGMACYSQNDDVGPISICL